MGVSETLNKRSELKGQCKRAWATDLFFVRPNFWSGVGSVLTPFGSPHRHYYWHALTSREVDRSAIYADWRMVGQDLQCAMNEFEAKHAEELATARQCLNRAG